MSPKTQRRRLASWLQLPMSSERLRAAFALFDTDKSGFLSANELLEILMRPNPLTNAPHLGRQNVPMSAQDARKIIEDFDTNGAYA